MIAVEMCPTFLVGANLINLLEVEHAAINVRVIDGLSEYVPQGSRIYC